MIYASKFTVLALLHLQKKETTTEQQAEQTHNHLVSILVFVGLSYLFWDSCKC